MVDKARIIDNKTMRPGDVIIALPSSGVHFNGFSLVRKVFDIEHADLTLPVEELGGRSLGEVLLTPTRIYVKPVLALLEQVPVRGISHITGGGFYENIPRSIPEGLCARIRRADVRVLPVFDLIAKVGGIDERDMFNTFNMGVGMSLVVPAEDAEKSLEILRAHGEIRMSSARLSRTPTAASCYAEASTCPLCKRAVCRNADRHRRRRVPRLSGIGERRADCRCRVLHGGTAVHLPAGLRSVYRTDRLYPGEA